MYISFWSTKLEINCEKGSIIGILVLEVGTCFSINHPLLAKHEQP